MEENQLKEGWVTLSNSPKFHYVVEGKSLCNRWMYLGSDFSADDGVENKDDCKACRKAFLKRQSQFTHTGS